MTPEQFIAKWRGSTLTEKSASHQHFLDLCDLLDVPKPAEVDRHGTEYTFEKAVKKLKGEQGFVDVWKKHCFGWEYKGPRKNLVEAYAQVKQYTDDLENPPLLIVSDMQEIRIHTNFTNRIAQQHVIALPDLISVEKRQLLRHCFLAPERLEPTATRESVTAEAATRFASIAVLLRREYEPRRVAHFLNKVVFCLFVEDIELLPDRIFADILDEAVKRPADFAGMLSDLFRAMANRNSRFGMTAIPWFNGGLFDDDDVLPVGMTATRDLQTAARLDWSAIDPSIFGTLFESGLDDKKRAEMASLFDPAIEPPAPQRRLAFGRAAPDRGVGIHYTDQATIMKIIEPVVLRPLRDEWDAIKDQVAALFTRKDKAKSSGEKTRLTNEARDLYLGFRSRLGKFRVLDPACGSGNFLALALMHLKDFDLAVIREAETIGLPADNQRVGPEAVLGIEINPYAAELARLTVWIAELQWQLRNNFELKQRHPILGRLDGIVCRDALINRDGSEAEWPKADVVIGNPPFLGDKLMIRRLGEDYTNKIRHAYLGRVPGGADLVCYWFEKARGLIEAKKLRRSGLVATNSIRGGANRKILDAIVGSSRLFEAWSDQPWVIDGAAVRVSLICFGSPSEPAASRTRLDGYEVSIIHADLTTGESDLTKAVPLKENEHLGFNGISKKGTFEIPGKLAREWLRAPANPNGRPNSDVTKPWINGLDVTRRPLDNWIVDFDERSEHDAALYELPFSWVTTHTRKERSKSRATGERRDWWLLARRAPAMRQAIEPLTRFIVVPEVSQYRLFVWVPKGIVPDKNVVIISRDDDTAFGIFQSKFHISWSLRQGTSLENRPRYTSKTTVRTFPFPEGLTPNIPAADYESDPRAIAIADAARELDRLRNAWLNPPDLIKIVPEVVPGFPDRILPANPAAEAVLKKRTLTNLYNERPTWLANAHRDLDAAVAAAYGWPADISEEDALARLLELNRARSATTKPTTKNAKATT